MRAVTLVHRWLGIPLCLLFAMWFASGIVMHFVPFPTLTEAERLDGLAPIELPQVLHSPSEAVQASGIKDVTRVRLLQRSDGPVFLVSAASGVAAFRAGNLSPAALPTQGLALAVALDHARRRGMDVAQAKVSALTAINPTPSSMCHRQPVRWCAIRRAANDGGTMSAVSHTGLIPPHCAAGRLYGTQRCGRFPSLR